MKATGITRRIDDLGRVVIPKEIRRTMRIREGDPLEIFTDRDGSIILRKYSPIGELSDLSKEYVEAVAGVTKCTVCISDRDIIVAAAGPDKKVYMGKQIHDDLSLQIDERKSVVEVGFIVEGEEAEQMAVSPIIAEGDAIGSVILIGKGDKVKFVITDTTTGRTYESNTVTYSGSGASSGDGDY